MENLPQKNILIGITGGIAAYKAAELVRLLIKQGYCVKVCMTQAATQFISPLTLQALSGQPVHTDLLDTQAEAAMGHIALAKWAQQIIIAPCSADFIARLAQGFANDLLSTVCLASAAPLAIVPAMNQQMWQHPAVQENIHILHNRDTHIWGPVSGQQACGDVGLGRMLEAVDIVKQLQQQVLSSTLLQGVRILITAGATREAIDPVRFISNRSSGKMGYAIAHVAQMMGAEVTLVSGVVTLAAPPQVERIIVESAKQMYVATMQQADNTDIFIATAAVADYSPIHVNAHKIKKTADRLSIELQKNFDILASISRQFPRIFTLGFAAETDNLIPYAREKLNNKKLNMIAANWVGADKAFDQDDNALEVLWKGGNHSLDNMSKPLLAKALLQLMSQHFIQYRSTL